VAVTWSGPASDTPSLLTAGQYVTLTPVWSTGYFMPLDSYRIKHCWDFKQHQFSSVNMCVYNISLAFQGWL
jgi:hypothetical protein